MSAGVSPATLLWATLETEVKSYSQKTKTKYRIHFPEPSDFVYLVPQLYVHYYCNIQVLLNKIILSSILISFFTDSKIHSLFFYLNIFEIGIHLKINENTGLFKARWIVNRVLDLIKNYIFIKIQIFKENNVREFLIHPTCLPNIIRRND